MAYQIMQRDATISDEIQSIDECDLIKQILANRGITREEELDRSLKSLPDYNTIPNIDVASSIIADAVMSDKRIFVIGDFDADGATSTALMVSALRKFGAAQVDYFVPNRFEYGYGLSAMIVDIAHQKGAELIITVDNGTSSIDGVQHANSLNIPVVVTDHHLAGTELPAAAAIVNPSLESDDFPFRNLAGVGVAFFVATATRDVLIQHNWFERTQECQPNMAEQLDIVSLGTIADIVKLDSVNRTLVYQGLRMVQRGRARPGVKALLAVSRKDVPELITAGDLGFAIAPKLNAAGRLSNMARGIELLTLGEDEHDLILADRIASELDQLNSKRKDIESKMQVQADKLTDRLTD